MVSQPLQAASGGPVHLGAYEAKNRAGWSPVCGQTGVGRWFRVNMTVTCPGCLGQAIPWTMTMVLDAVDNVADALERAISGTATDWNEVEGAVVRLRALRGQATGETDPVVRMRAVAQLYGAAKSNTDECEGCGLPESNCACG